MGRFGRSETSPAQQLDRSRELSLSVGDVNQSAPLRFRCRLDPQRATGRLVNFGLELGARHQREAAAVRGSAKSWRDGEIRQASQSGQEPRRSSARPGKRAFGARLASTTTRRRALRWRGGNEPILRRRMRISPRSDASHASRLAIIRRPEFMRTGLPTWRPSATEAGSLSMTTRSTTEASVR